MNPNHNLYNDYARFSLRYLDTVNQIMRQLDLVNRNFYQIATRNYRYGSNTTNRYSRRYTNPDNIWTSPLNINTNTNPTMQNWAANFLNNTFWNNVVVYPTQTEIENATSQVALSDLPPGTISCPITMERFTENTEILRINHCGHVFTRDAILRWFRNHVNCPVCRHDIRTQAQGAAANTHQQNDETNAESNAASNANPNVHHQVYQFDFTLDTPDMMTNIINGLSNLNLGNDLTNNLANTINNSFNSTNNGLRNRYNPSRYNSGSGPNNTDQV